MENMICPSCGNETPRDLPNCKHCGAKNNPVYSDNEFAIKERNGFVTFYLWLGLVVNSLMAAAYFVTLFTSKGLWTAYDPMWERIYGVICSAIMCIGYYNLLKWKRMGFVILAGIAVVVMIINMGTTGFSLATFQPILSLAILYAVLQIRKNGVFCWESLS